MNAARTYVLVTGAPAAGKTTLAQPLADHLGLALLGKDAIKEALYGELGIPQDVQQGRRLGRAAVMTLLRLARTCPGAVLDSTFPAYAHAGLRQLPGRLIEVHCVAPRAVVLARYEERKAQRHPGHLDRLRAPERLWEEHGSPVGLGTLLEVDTSRPVDVAKLAGEVRAAVALG